VPHRSLDQLQEVIDSLLGPGGCPWDQKQTPESLCDYVLEEAFELVDAVRRGDAAEVREELGDLLFLLLFLSRLYKETGEFDLGQALEANAAKMIRRHPHVFGDTTFADQEALLRNWELVKREEKAEAGKPLAARRTYSSLPKGLPPMLKAYRIHSKAARVGFTWTSDETAWAQLEAERQEWLAARASGDPAQEEEEFGDYLFTLVEVGRRAGIKANAALAQANEKFLRRFGRMEDVALARGSDLTQLSLNELNALWDEAKARDKPTAHDRRANMHDVVEILRGLRDTPAILDGLVRAMPEDRLHLRRGEGCWTIAEHAAHLADAQPMFAQRLQRILAESEPEFVPFFPDEGDAPAGAASPDVGEALRAFANGRAAQLALLENASPEDWRRKARHPEYAEYGLYILARHMLMHDHWHMHRMEELWLTRDAYFSG